MEVCEPIVRKGLVIGNPWISHILAGQKDWEMRSEATSHRGWFGLIWKGMGCVYGVARLVEVRQPLDVEQMVATFDHHRIPEDMIRFGGLAKWNIPWVLSDVIRLPSPVRYRHPSGAVTWVRFTEEVSRAIQEQLTLLKIPAGHSALPAIGQEQQYTPSNPSGWLVIGRTELSQGNLNNNHFYLGKFFDRFPKDAVGGSNKAAKAPREVSVSWEGGPVIHTDLDGTKKMFRQRGWVGTFLRLHNARAGDFVVVEAEGPYRYRVRIERRSTIAI
ncbi:hypothetical protein GCM10023174_23670 [Chelativorans composti]|uniref:ASCH domain-containing protein n=1 Tax=Chelativorans composti TaxID=768533 RepID=A0ABW5DFE7_9HYPH